MNSKKIGMKNIILISLRKYKIHVLEILIFIKIDKLMKKYSLKKK